MPRVVIGQGSNKYELFSDDSGMFLFDDNQILQTGTTYQVYGFIDGEQVDGATVILTTQAPQAFVNIYQQPPEPPTEPQPVVGETISSGYDHTCAIENNQLYCWGSNASQQLEVPDDLINPQVVSAGSSFTCALANNQVRCWGLNVYGQTAVPTLSNPITVSAGSSHVCAIDDTGVVCWGHNGDGKTYPQMASIIPVRWQQVIGIHVWFTMQA